MLTLIAGLRYKVGGDTISYHEQYRYWPTINEFSINFSHNSRYAIGYQLLWSLCKSINIDFWFYQMAHAVIVNSTFFYLFKKTNRTFLAILLYFLYSYFFYNMEILRAAISVCIFIYSLKFYAERKWFSYYGCALFALLFHTESIVLLLFPLLSYLKRIKTNLYGLLGIVIFSFILLNIFNFIPIVNNFIIYLGIMQDGLANFYSNIRDYNFNAIIFVILQIASPIIILYVQRDNKRFQYKEFLILYIALTILTLKYTVFFIRINDFITPILLFCMADIFSISQPDYVKKNTVLKRTMITLFICVSFFNYTKNSYYPEYKKYYPYSSVLNPKENPEREWYVRDLIINR